MITQSAAGPWPQRSQHPHPQSAAGPWPQRSQRPHTPRARPGHTSAASWSVPSEASPKRNSYPRATPRQKTISTTNLVAEIDEIAAGSLIEYDLSLFGE